MHADDQEWANKGKRILQDTGAEDISSIGETRGDFSNTDRPTQVVAPVDVVHHAEIAKPVEIVEPVEVVEPVKH